MPRFLAAGQFTPYGPSHWGVLALFAVGAAVMVLVGRRQRGQPSAQLFSRGFALVVLAWQVPMQIYTMLPGQWNLNYSLPLQLSDFAWMAAAYALWSHRRWIFALTYYWGLTLTSQALLTPQLSAADFPSTEFVMFWGVHLLTIWAAIYLTWGLDIRPDWRSLHTAVACTFCWAVVMFGVNRLLGSDYGFLNGKPGGRSLLDVLGDWPWYLLSEFAIALVVWVLITWPWVRGAKSHSIESDETARTDQPSP